jgi:hypothetical protein
MDRISYELKAVLPSGYKFIECYEFSKIDLFSDYVNNFFEMKRNSVGAETFIAKMLLNQLYGIFGRKLDLIETINVNIEDLVKYIGTRVVNSIIPINDKIVTIIWHSKRNPKWIEKLNLELNTDIRG